MRLAMKRLLELVIISVCVQCPVSSRRRHLHFKIHVKEGFRGQQCILCTCQVVNHVLTYSNATEYRNSPSNSATTRSKQWHRYMYHILPRQLSHLAQLVLPRRAPPLPRVVSYSRRAVHHGGVRHAVANVLEVDVDLRVRERAIAAACDRAQPGPVAAAPEVDAAPLCGRWLFRGGLCANDEHREDDSLEQPVNTRS